MIFFQRRRLLIWLLKAYIRKWKKIILVFFGLGLLTFFLLYFIFSHFTPFYLGGKQVVGVLGTYSSSNLPNYILDKISYGLTEVSSDGRVHAGAAESWKIDNNGKNYTFYLKDGLYFTDGTKFSSKEINYNFENVSVERPDKKTIVFKLKENYSPFLITVSRPVFIKNYVGMGNYKISSLNLNGEFIDSIQLQSVRGLSQRIVYQFYPTEESLKTALVLGEITTTRDISDLSFKQNSLVSFANFNVKKMINYNKLTTLFYNTQNKVLSDKRLRQALTYALPNNYNEGRRNVTPYPPTLWADRSDSLSYEQDFEHAKLLLAASSASGSSKLNIKIQVLPQYKQTASEISQAWKKIGISSTTEIVDSLQSDFQVFLGEFYVSKDPDQYTLWHSDQPNNVTGYKNLRIDKLLEDGRQTVDMDKREKIYADFQKYLLDDSPAAFLFFPYSYSLTKK